MTKGLTDKVVALITPDQLQKLGVRLDKDSDATANMVYESAALLVSGLAEIAASPGGTTRIDNILAREGITGTDQLDETLTKDSHSEGMELAQEILANSVGKTAASQESERTLGLIAPLVISVVARYQRDHELEAASIGSFLIAERDKISVTLKKGLEIKAETHTAAEAQLAAQAIRITRDEAAKHAQEEQRRRKYVWPFVALFAIGGTTVAVVLSLTLSGG